MDTINNDLTNLLQQMGVHKESLGITQRIVIIAGILIIAFVADYFCIHISMCLSQRYTNFTTDWSDLYGQLDLKTVWICVICGEFVYLCDKHMEIWIQ